MVYIKPEYPTPPNPISTQEDLNTIKYKSLGDQKITNSLLQLLIEWSTIFGSRSKVREKFQLKRSK